MSFWGFFYLKLITILAYKLFYKIHFYWKKHKYKIYLTAYCYLLHVNLKNTNLFIGNFIVCGLTRKISRVIINKTHLMGRKEHHKFIIGNKFVCVYTATAHNINRSRVLHHNFVYIGMQRILYAHIFYPANQ